MSRVRNALFGLSFTLFGAAIGFAGSSLAGPGGHMPPGGHFVRALEQLDLTDAQEKMIDELRLDGMAAFREHREEKVADHKELVAAVKAGKLDRKVVHQKVDERMAAMKDDMHDLTDRLMDLYDSLSADQRAELVKMIEDHEARRGDDGPSGGHPGGHRR